MTNELRIKFTDGTEKRFRELISFRFVKDAYTPYTTLNARFLTDTVTFEKISEVTLKIGNYTVHHGIADELRVERTADGMTASVSSRGFTSLLCQNQIEQGIKFHTSINSLMDSYYSLPYVTHEDNSDNSSYIYVKSHSTMWDGVVNLAYKLVGTYPFISGTNCVRITPPAEPRTFTFDNSQIIGNGIGTDTRHIISHFNMANISGDYDEFTLTDSYAVNRNLIRHCMFDLDKQFLYEPQQAVEYRDKFARRGCLRKYCRYSGYNGEDLCDILSFGNIVRKQIGRIEVNGNSEGIFTELSVYYDAFYVNGIMSAVQ